MIDLERRDKALQYLIDTDEKTAKARAYQLGLEKQEKTIIGTLVLASEGTVAEKEATARTSHEYKCWREDYENAVADYEILKNRRHTAELIIEVWRSEGANRRQGNIT
jgi:hypothetical protein